MIVYFDSYDEEHYDVFPFHLILFTVDLVASCISHINLGNFVNFYSRLVIGTEIWFLMAQSPDVLPDLELRTIVGLLYEF